MEPDLSPHTILVEGDLVWLTVRGEFTRSHLDAMNSLIEEVLRSQGYLLTLINVSEGRMLSREVRRQVAESTRDTLHRTKAQAASAAYGAGAVVTGLMSLLFSALRIMTKGSHKNTLVRTEAEARAFLSEQRCQFRRELGLDGPASR